MKFGIESSMEFSMGCFGGPQSFKTQKQEAGINIIQSNTPDSEKKPQTKEAAGICAANKKDRRKCPVVTPSYETCHECPFCGIGENDINLGDPNKRGGVEDSRESAAWRKNKLIHGIPHGDD